MAKSLLALFLSAIYLAITVGIPVSIHHCHGQNEISITIAGESDCGCSSNAHEMGSCCSFDLKDLQHCKTDHYQSGCCTHETKVVVWDSKQQLAQKTEFKIHITEIDLYHSQLLFDVQIAEYTENSNEDYLINPPPKIIPLQILNQEFIFYG